MLENTSKRVGDGGNLVNEMTLLVTNAAAPAPVMSLGNSWPRGGRNGGVLIAGGWLGLAGGEPKWWRR